MDAHSNPRRTLKSAQEQDQLRRRNKRDRARRAAETAEQRSERLRKRRKRDRARRTAQTASKRQATSQQRSTHERERMATETPKEKDYSRKVHFCVNYSGTTCKLFCYNMQVWCKSIFTEQEYMTHCYILLFYSTILLVSSYEIYLTLEHDFYKQYSTVEHDFYKLTLILQYTVKHTAIYDEVLRSSGLL